jgi:hypothetical protein
VFCTLSYDVRDLRSCDKCVPNILLCDVFASLISVSSILIQAVVSSHVYFFYDYKLIFNLINLWYDFTGFLNSLFIPFFNLSGQISSFF